MVECPPFKGKVNGSTPFVCNKKNAIIIFYILYFYRYGSLWIPMAALFK